MPRWHDVYAWYEQVENDLAIFNRDADVHALTAELVSAQRERALERVRGRI